MQKTLLIFVFVLCCVLSNTAAQACTDAIPRWSFRLVTQTDKIMPLKEAGCLDPNCLYIYTFRSDQTQKYNSLDLASENYGWGHLKWRSEEAQTTLYSDFSMSGNSRSINESKNLWLKPLKTLTQVDTGPLEKIWSEIYAEKQNLNAKSVVITNTSQITFDKLTVINDDQSYFSCDTARKVMAFQVWRIEYSYAPQHCVPIPTLQLCDYYIYVPVIYVVMVIGALVLGFFVKANF